MSFAVDNFVSSIKDPVGTVKRSFDPKAELMHSLGVKPAPEVGAAPPPPNRADAASTYFDTLRAAASRRGRESTIVSKAGLLGGGSIARKTLLGI